MKGPRDSKAWSWAMWLHNPCLMLHTVGQFPEEPKEQLQPACSAWEEAVAHGVSTDCPLGHEG